MIFQHKINEARNALIDALNAAPDEMLARGRDSILVPVRVDVLRTLISAANDWDTQGRDAVRRLADVD